MGPSALLGQGWHGSTSYRSLTVTAQTYLRGVAPVSATEHAAVGARQRRVQRSTRCNYQPQRVDPDRDLRRNVPSAPPPGFPPPPPPPPPPPSEEIASGISVSKRGLLGGLLGGSLLYYAAVAGLGGPPLAGVDRRRNIALVRTKGGNLVAATQDEAGRVFMFDRAGNIYYDTEDSKLGVYIVDTRGNMYNAFADGEGRPQRVAVGNIADLRTVTVKEVGGVDVRELQQSIRGLRGGRLTGFPQVPDASNLQWEDLMPPNAPASVNRNGDLLEPPPMLEDLELDLESRGGGLFGGGGGGGKGGGGGGGDLAETLKGLQRGEP